MPGSSVYICYSHKDERWLDRLLLHLRPLEQSGTIELWEDRLIKPGEEWYAEIENAINKASIAILLISESFLASSFLQHEEVPRLLSRRETEGLQIIPIIIKPCAWTNIQWLSKLQVRPRNTKPLSQKNKKQTDTDLTTVAREITSLTSQVNTINISKNLERSMPSNIEKDDSGTKRNIFVVHGRNEPFRRSLFDFLRAIGLNPIEWTKAVSMTGKGSPFIGDVLDQAMEQAQAIVVLFTGDDEARLKHEFQSEHDPNYEKVLTPQARPNVLFEAGMAFGKYPDRTILVQAGSLRPFSDIAGRHLIHINDSLKARQDLALRLQNAGCSVELSGVDWHSAGKFSIVRKEEEKVKEVRNKPHTRKKTSQFEKSGKISSITEADLNSPTKEVSLFEKVSEENDLPVGAIYILVTFSLNANGNSITFLGQLTGINPLRIEKHCELLESRGFIIKGPIGLYSLTNQGKMFLLETGLI